MAITSKYFITNADLDTFIDFGLPYGSLTLDGQEIKVIGSAAEESIFVRPGMTVDFTSSSGGVDKIYLEGNFAEYTISTNAGVATLTGGGATVTFSKGSSELGSDRLVFADGTVNSWHIFGGGTITPVPGSETSLLPDPPAAPGSAQRADVEAIALDSSGETFALVRPGIDYTVTGSAGVDSVYVSRGATVDARGLRGSRDDIYFTGQWGDYSKTVGNGDLTFTRTVDGHAESVRVSAGTGSNNDRLIFADGAVLSNNAKGALANPIVPITEIPGYSATPATPLPAAPVIDLVAGDDIITVNEQGSAIIGTSFAHARIALTLGAGNVQTATADAQGHWSYTLRPDDITAMGEGPETISAVAMDTHGNLSAPATRPITIDGNHAPTNSGPLSGSGNENDPSHTLNLLANTTDSDGDPLTVGSLTYTVNGTATGNGGADLPTGVSLSGSTLSIDTNNTGFNSLAAGEQQSITAKYTISDGHGGTVNQSATFTVNGVNDAPGFTGKNTNSLSALFATQAVQGTAVAGAEIGGPVGVPSYSSQPTMVGWLNEYGGPYVNDYQNSMLNIASGYMSHLNGVSMNGGNFAVLTSMEPTSAFGHPEEQSQLNLNSTGSHISTTLTGLVTGKTYTYGVQWQQFSSTFNYSNINPYNGGSLIINVDGKDQQIYTGTSLDDGWTTALYTFTAAGSTAQVNLIAAGGANGSALNGTERGNIAVDSLNADQIHQHLGYESAAGMSLGSFLAGVSDVDHNAVLKGYAVVDAASDGVNHWQYKNGSTWINLDSASESSAFFLSADTLVRWTGTAGTNTTLNARAVDNSESSAFDIGSQGHLNTVGNGGATPYSANLSGIDANGNAVASGEVTAGVNHAPMVNNDGASSIDPLFAAPVNPNTNIITLTPINDRWLGSGWGWGGVGSAAMVNDANNSVFGGSSTLTNPGWIRDVNGNSLSGGTFLQFYGIMNYYTSSLPSMFDAHGASFDIGTVVAGETYTVAVQWQQVSMQLPATAVSEGYIPRYSGGQLAISHDGYGTASQQVYYSAEGGPGDGWQTAVYTFTAAETTANASLYFTLHLDGGNMAGAIVVDTLTREQTVAAAAQQGAGMTTSAAFGTASDSDAGATLKGWAITSAAADSAGHHWQYSTDGTTWSNMDVASASQAIYLSPTDQIRWTGLKGTNTELDAKAVDDTGPALHAANTEATLIDVSASGGSTAFSAGTAVLAANAPPLLFDLNHDGRIDYSQITMNRDGHQVDTAWVGADDGILVWDKCNDGQVHDSEQYVFGQTTGSDLSGLQQGFDSNNDLVFDARDAQFNQFGIWQDVNQNGAVDAGEYHTLGDLGIAALSLTSDGVASTPASGVTVQGQTTATLTDGSTMLVADAIFSSERSATEVVPATGINPTESNPDGGDQVIHCERIDQVTDSVTAYAVYSQGDYAQMLLDSAIVRAGL